MTFSVLGGGSSSYKIQRSLRFRSSASAYLNRTPASTSNQQKFTWSGWIKRGQLASVQRFLSAGTGGGDAKIGFLSDDTLQFQDDNTGANVITTQVFRDPSAWYHVIYSVDSTQATAANRVLLYINGVNVTAFSTATYMAQNANSYFNSANAHYIGRRYSGGEQLDGYLAEVNFIDGQALTPSSFGQTDTVTGVWTPKKYTGTYGTNGFYLPFSDNTSATTLAYDKSGNGNNWTPNNISTTAGATYDSMTDVPTLTSATAANYCVLNPLNKPSGFTISGGNLNLSSTVDNNNCVGTLGMTSGKWYFEFVPSNMSSGASVVGIAKDPINTGTYVGGSANSWGYHPNAMKYNNASGSSYGATYTDGDVIGVAFDADAGSLTFYKNGTSQGVAFSGLSAGTYFANIQSNNGGTSVINFGQRPFSYTPPTGFKALNTFNLPDPTIKKPNQYMDATLYTGNGTTQTITNAGGFQPDMVWAKSRSRADPHDLYDSVRGALKSLYPNSTEAEYASGNLSSFNSNGFSLNGTGSGGNVNYNGATYVGWQWKESATAGFDIVTYTGNGTAGRTVSHSLGVAPKMIFVKVRSNSDNWQVGHDSMGWNGFMYLNLTNGYTATSSAWNNTAPTSSVFTVGSDTRNNYSGYTYVAYLFAEIPGYSKFGSYTGNLNADGPYTYLGFRPKLVMWKRTDSTGDWIIFDSIRDTYNYADKQLVPNTSGAEQVTGGGFVRMDFLSNGFKVRSTDSYINASGGTYIYAAFAEFPTKYSLAR